MFQSGNYTQQQLPSELFNNTGEVTYNGMVYNVSNKGNGTRDVTVVGTDNPVARLLKEAQAKYDTALADYNKKYGEFETNNPFVFDNVLNEERAKVKQRLDPYYEQTLSDFLKGVNTQRSRGLEDERTLLSQLDQDVTDFQGEQKRQLDDTLEKSRQGYADAGLYNSGERMRAEGTAQANTNQNITNNAISADRSRNRITLAQNRLEEDLSQSEATKRRDLTQEESYNVDTQAYPEVTQRQQQREFERGQYTGAPPGVDPLTFQNNLYSLIR